MSDVTTPIVQQNTELTPKDPAALLLKNATQPKVAEQLVNKPGFWEQKFSEMFTREFLDVIGKDGIEKKWFIGFKDVRGVGHYMKDDPDIVKDENYYRTMCEDYDTINRDPYAVLTLRHPKYANEPEVDPKLSREAETLFFQQLKYHISIRTNNYNNDDCILVPILY